MIKNAKCLPTFERSNRPFTASHSRRTKPPCWRARVALGQDKQKTYIILNGNFLCLSCPSATFALQHASFVPREWLAANGLFPLSLSVWKDSRSVSGYLQSTCGGSKPSDEGGGGGLTKHFFRPSGLSLVEN